MSERIFDPFKFANKKCPPLTQKKARTTKRNLIVIGTVGIILIASISIFLYYGMESTLYFKLNEFDNDGNPIGRLLTPSEYPIYPINFTVGSEQITMTSENISRAFIQTVGFIFIERNLLEELILDDNNFSLFMVALQLKFAGVSSIVQSELVENFDSIIPYRDYLYNNSVVVITGNFIQDRFNELVWKFQAYSYCIPMFTMMFELNGTDITYDMFGLWTRLLNTRNLLDAQIGRGVYEIQISDIQYNYTTINAFNQGDLPTILQITRPQCYFNTSWAYRNWWFDDISVFKPVDQIAI